MKNTKQKLIQIGAKLFLAHSYHGTGINDILKACEVPKGSFYNYFKSKEDFALEVVMYQMNNNADFVKQNLCNEQLAPIDRVSEYLDSISQGLVDCHFAMGCPFGTLAQEMANLSPKLREILTKAFQIQLKHLVHCILLGQQQGVIKSSLNADETAGFIMSSLQGAQIMAKTFLSDQPLHEVRHIVVDILLPIE